MKEFTQRIGEFLGFNLDFLFGTNTVASQTMDAMIALCVKDDCCQYHQFRYRGLLAQTSKRLCAGLQSTDQKIGRVYRHVLNTMTFQKDPPVMHNGKMVETDYLKSPCRIFQEIDENGKATGDCDDFAIYLAGLYKYAGLSPGFVAVSNDGKVLDHVVCFVENPERGVDSTLDPQGWDPRTYRGITLRRKV